MAKNSRSETEMSALSDTIRDEMADAVRVLGGDGHAKVASLKAARACGLSVSVVERLRYRKIARIPADVADAVREALLRHVEAEEARARHEAAILRARLARYPHLDREASGAQRASAGSAGAEDRAVDR